MPADAHIPGFHFGASLRCNGRHGAPHYSAYSTRGLISDRGGNTPRVRTAGGGRAVFRLFRMGAYLRRPTVSVGTQLIVQVAGFCQQRKAILPLLRWEASCCACPYLAERSERSGCSGVSDNTRDISAGCWGVHLRHKELAGIFLAFHSGAYVRPSAILLQFVATPSRGAYLRPIRLSMSTTACGGTPFPWSSLMRVSLFA